MKIQDQVSITAPLYRGYLWSPQYIVGASLRPLVKLLICPTSQRKLVKPSFFCDSHGYNTKIPRFSEAGITLWRDLFKVRNPPVSSMVIIFAIITSGVSQGTRNHSVSKRRNLTHKECVTLLMEELRHQTVDGEFWWQFRNEQRQYATLWRGGGKTRWWWCYKREEKTRAWARLTLEDSAETETTEGRNWRGEARIMKVIQQWLGSTKHNE